MTVIGLVPAMSHPASPHFLFKGRVPSNHFWPLPRRQRLRRRVGLGRFQFLPRRPVASLVERNRRPAFGAPLARPVSAEVVATYQAKPMRSPAAFRSPVTKKEKADNWKRRKYQRKHPIRYVVPLTEHFWWYVFVPVVRRGFPLITGWHLGPVPVVPGKPGVETDAELQVSILRTRSAIEQPRSQPERFEVRTINAQIGTQPATINVQLDGQIGN